ncbi:uncharacterized protein METZ01_LOCUS161964 [marine metagenome]|uniref:Uncharacterized protein n=1 Tax=marine metagenome TaxID=408172 RepID=A0A382B5J3_9ZZZZ
MSECRLGANTLDNKNINSTAKVPTKATTNTAVQLVTYDSVTRPPEEIL